MRWRGCGRRKGLGISGKTTVNDPNSAVTGRTPWDFIHSHLTITLIVLGCTVVIVLGLFLYAYINTAPGKPVILFGNTIIQKPGTQPPSVVTPPRVPLPKPGAQHPPNGPPVISADTLEELRTQTGVLELYVLQDDLPLSNLPDGVYGFAPPWTINSDSTGAVGGTDFDRLTLGRTSVGTAVMEIHKATSGSVYVIGYVAMNSLVLLQNPTRSDPIDVILSFQAYQDWVPIGVPATKILHSNNRSITSDDGRSFYVNDMRIR